MLDEARGMKLRGVDLEEEYNWYLREKEYCRAVRLRAADIRSRLADEHLPHRPPVEVGGREFWDRGVYAFPETSFALPLRLRSSLARHPYAIPYAEP